MTEFRLGVGSLVPDVSEEVHRELFNGWAAVGSRATCTPFSEDADVDYLIDVYDINEAQTALEAEGFILDDSGAHRYVEISQFISMRKGNLNLIITEDTPFFERFLAATHVAKTLNLQHKEDRIMLFQAVLYGKSYYPQTE